MGDGTGNALRRLGGRRLIASVDDDAGAEGRQKLGDRQADTAGTTDDNRAAACQRLANPPSPRTSSHPCSRSHAGS